MKGFIAVIFIVIVLLVLGGFTSCTYVSQGEKVFQYNVSSGKVVNPKDNPLLPIGIATAWGVNEKFFTVQGTIMDYEFSVPKNSKGYDETLNWNSKEGVVMSASYKLYGRVTDVWEFFTHFGEPEHSYDVEGHKDVKVYEALRQAGKILDKELNEFTGSTEAEAIRTNQYVMKQTLLEKVQPYMRRFGFEVTDLMFVGNFQYPDGNTITEARKQLTDMSADIRTRTQEKQNKASQAKIDIDQASIEATNTIRQAERQASIIRAESTALATALGQSIQEVGIEGTLKIKMAELYGTLAKAGVIPHVVVTEDSIFASPFYPAAVLDRSRTREPSTNTPPLLGTRSSVQK